MNIRFNHLSDGKIKKKGRKIHLFRIIFVSALFFSFKPQPREFRNLQVPQNTISIFLLDTSSSMNENSKIYFQEVKQFLKSKIEQCRQYDRIMVFIFDDHVEKVIDEKISHETNKEALIHIIDQIEANGRWTWIWQAFTNLKQTLTELGPELDQGKLNIFLLTDGLDDPPLISGEPPKRLVTVTSPK